jgi:hypothetical protein
MTKFFHIVRNVEKCTNLKKVEAILIKWNNMKLYFILSICENICGRWEN